MHYMDTIDKLLSNGETHVRKILLKMRQKELVPFYHLVADKGDDVILPCNFANDIQKQITFLTAKEIAKEIKAVAGMFVSESWMVSVERAEYPTTPPSQHPNRIEVVMLVATTGRETRSRSLRIIRAGGTETGRIIDLIANSTEDLGEISGRMIEGLIAPERLNS